MKVMPAEIRFAVILAVAFLPVTPVQAQAFRASWICFSIDIGSPVIGMVRDPANSARFDYSGQGTSWIDGIASLTAGWTPVMVTPTIGVGLAVRASAALSFGDNGKVDVYSSLVSHLVGWEVKEGEVHFLYMGTWAAISPMLATRLLLRPGAYVTLGAGPAFWQYLSMEYKGGYQHDNLLDETAGVSPAATAQILIEWFCLEAGIIGPDVFFGLGFLI